MAKAVDHRRRPPRSSAVRQWPTMPACEREGEKSTDREQRNQPIGDAAENDDRNADKPVRT